MKGTLLLGEPKDYGTPVFPGPTLPPHIESVLEANTKESRGKRWRKKRKKMSWVESSFK